MGEQTNYTETPRENDIIKVIKGNAQIDKPSFGKKIIDFLFTDKMDSVAGYLASYILGPGLKELIFKLGTGALQMALFNGQGGAQMPPLGWNNSVNNGWSNGYATARRDPTPYNMMMSNGYAQPQPGLVVQRMDLNNISFDSKDDVYRVLDRMNQDIKRYGMVRVADFYTYAGITGQESNWTLQGNGWCDLNYARPMMRTDGRWIIDFPPVVPLR